MKKCSGCKAEIDPNVCGCGTSKKEHGNPMDEGHSFVPMGCNCFRSSAPKKLKLVKRITAWGPSRLALYNDCPAKAKYKHIDKLPDPGGPAMVRGNKIHAAAEAYIWKRTNVRHPDLKHAKIMALLRQLRKAASEKRVRTELEIALNKQWKPCEWLAPEVYVRIKLDVVLFSKDGTSAEVIDWKTGKAYTAGEKPEYVDQLSQYSVILMSAFPKLGRVESRLVFTDAGQEVQVPEGNLARDNLAAAQRHWDMAAKPLLTDTLFKPKPGRSCAYCPYSANKGGPCQY